MESTTNGQHAVDGHRCNSGITTPPDRKQPLSIPRGLRSAPRSSRAADYSAFADEVYRDLAPKGALERLIASHVVHNAWKLKANLETQAARDRSEKPEGESGGPKRRVRPTELDQASRAMRQALESLDYLRNRSRPLVECMPTSQEIDVDLLSNEWPIVPGDDTEVFPELSQVAQIEVTSWRDRLVFDFDVSDISPVVRGTWITVGHVVTLIVDGWTWADILRSHPELCEDDIRTCVAYAMAEESSAA